MEAVEVRDTEGNVLGKVKVGETVRLALERLRRNGMGGLYDKDDLGCLDNEIITYEGGPYVFKKMQRTSARLDVVDAKHAANATLTKSSLENDTLRDYLEVACKFKQQPESANVVLRQIEDMMDKSESISPFVCIFDSSGTGKTQLAATTVFLRPDSKVVYLYAGQADEETAQHFYRPHIPLWRYLKNLLTDFCLKVNHGSAELPGAGEMKSWTGEHNVITSFNMIFFWQKDCNTVKDLAEKVRRMGKHHFYVFVDEIPPKNKNKNFAGLALRNFLRAIGIVPILMSTHSGSHNAIPVGSDSRTEGGDTTWCRVITKLPAKCTKPIGYETENERPLVARIMSAVPNNGSLADCVRAVRENLLVSKPGAWRKSPIFQLCQLFRSTRDPSQRTLCSHRLVGEHFGHFELPEGGSDFARAHVGSFSGTIRMPEAETEPVLFLALASWYSCDFLSKKFPLQDEDGNAISVRKAFEMCKVEFTAPAFVVNPEAMKNDGNLMEVLALASMTLASLCADNGLLRGVPMSKFIAIVFCLMLNIDDLGGEISKLQASIDGMIPEAFATTVPPVPPADSNFPDVLFGNYSNPWKGRLKRPADNERRDGVLEIMSSTPISTLVQVECKNYLDGLGTTTLQAVIARMRVNVPVAFLFTSKVKGIWQDKEKHEKFWTDMGLGEGEMCVLYLAKGEEPTWATTLTDITLEPAEGCKYLLVIFAVEAVGTA